MNWGNIEKGACPSCGGVLIRRSSTRTGKNWDACLGCDFTIGSEKKQRILDGRQVRRDDVRMDEDHNLAGLSALGQEEEGDNREEGGML